MRVLVTGAWGFVGRHAVRDLVAAGHDVIAADQITSPGDPPPPATAHRVDITDPIAVLGLVADTHPGAVLHLAGISFVPRTAADPGLTIKVNANGTLNILDACLRHAPSARILVVSTAQVYGSRTGDLAVDETAPLRPDSIYGISKTAADQLALFYAAQHKLQVMVARPNNHIGPGQSPQFAVASFAAQIKAATRSPTPPVIATGNLESRRDFTDVRDVAVAYRLLLERGRIGLAYNIGSGSDIKIGDLLKMLCELAGVAPRFVTDKALLRPTDRSPNLELGRIKQDTGWAPARTLRETLSDILACA